VKIISNNLCEKTLSYQLFLFVLLFYI